MRASLHLVAMSSARPADQCPICHTELTPGAAECLRCGEMFAPPAQDAGADAAEAEPTVGRREKFLYYGGIALILLGGPGIALGSWLHDVLRISYLNYDAFSVFGPVNQLVLAVGLITMTVGTVFLLLSLRLSRPPGAEDAS